MGDQAPAPCSCLRCSCCLLEGNVQRLQSNLGCICLTEGSGRQQGSPLPQCWGGTSPHGGPQQTDLQLDVHGRAEKAGQSTCLRQVKLVADARGHHAGVVGVPNVGKSSLINSLLRTRAVAVGNLPGITKVPQVTP